MAQVKIKESTNTSLSKDKFFELTEITSAGICVLEDDRGQKFHVLESEIEYQGGITNLNG